MLPSLYSSLSVIDVFNFQRLIETTITGKAETMFKHIVHVFMEARRAATSRVERRLADTLDTTAKEVNISHISATRDIILTVDVQVETALSQAWAVAGYNMEEVAARDHARDVVTDIRIRLMEMENALKSAMERAEKDVPSCYPPPTIPDDDE